VADYFKANTVRLSMSGFSWGDQVYTTFGSACIRKILLYSKDVQAPIPIKYTKLGAKNEDLYANVLAFPYEREGEVSGQITETVGYTGHFDYCVDGPYGKEVHELKCTDSKSTLYNVIVRGNYRLENLAQTVAYMDALEVERGQLIYTYYLEGIRDTQRSFIITLADSGQIIVDGEPIKFYIQDIHRHKLNAAQAIENDTVWQRPEGWQQKFGSPCGLCKFKDTCDSYDAGVINTTQEFIDSAKQSLERSM
jgi:hypothetical protein